MVEKNQKNKSKKLMSIMICIILLFPLLKPYYVNAERVYGNGASFTSANGNRTNEFLDTTVDPPLGLAWKRTNVNSIPIKGMPITNYRLYYGQGDKIIGLNNQTNKTRLDAYEPRYDVANPFEATFNKDIYGNISSAVEIMGSSSTTSLEPSGTQPRGLFFGTDKGFIGRTGGHGLEEGQGDQNIEFSITDYNQSTGQIFNPLFGGAIQHIGYASSSNYILAASDLRFHLIENKLNTVMDRMWYFDISNISGSNYQSGVSKITGLTQLTKNDNAFLISVDNGPDEGYGLIYKNQLKKVGQWTQVQPTVTIRYNAGLPKPAAFSEDSNRIYAVDKEGRFHGYDLNGNRLFQPGYVGDSPTRGYDSVSGVLLYNGHGYASSLSSSLGTNKGTITKFSLSDPRGSKQTYIHDAQITTTPISLSGYIYFGDENGRVFSLDPNTMNVINWYLDETISSAAPFYKLGNSKIEYLSGADNHLFVQSADGIYAFKGRPDYYIHALNDNTGATLNNKRYNFTSSSLPTINLQALVGNKGTFDYNIYDDFNGVNHQFSTFGIRNTDSNTNIPINFANITLPSAYHGKYLSESKKTNKQYFQVPAGGEKAQLGYSFVPSEEGEYEITAFTDKSREQKEFDEDNNDATATVKVVDMRKPTATSYKTSYKPGETISFSLSKTQKYSYSSYRFVIQNSSGSSTVWTSTNTIFPGSLTTSINNKGSYRYRVEVNNRYGDIIASDWKTFDVVNTPPVAGFNTDKATYYMDQTIKVTSTASDPDNDPLTYLYEITRPDGSKTTSNLKDPSLSSLIRGTYTIKQTVSDSYSSDSITKTVNVINRNPIAAFTYSPSTIYNNTNVVFSNTSSDADNDPLSYKWSYQAPGTSSWTQFSTSTNPNRVFTQKGVWNIRLEVNDGQGGTDSFSRTLTVGNRAPNVDFTFSPSTIFNDTTVSFDNLSTDDDNDVLSYKWYYQTPNSSTWQQFSTATDPSRIFTTKGTWNIKLEGTDSSGAMNFKTKTLSVGNRNPVALYDYSPSVIYNDTTVSFVNKSTDPDNDTLSFKWEIQAPSTATWNQISTGTNTSRIFPTKGNWNVRLEATDTSGAKGTHTKSLTVSNRNPVANFTFSPGTIYNDTNVTFQNSSTDADNDNLSFKWSYQLPNSSTWTQFSTSKDPNRIFVNKGDWNIRLEVEDGFGGYSSQVKVLKVSNRNPVANFSYSPSQIFNDTVVTFSNLSSDVDNDTLSYKWFRQSPGSTAWQQFSTSKNPTNTFTTKGNWNIKLEVSDGFGGVDTQIRELTVENRNPVVDFSYAPTTIYNDTQVKFTNLSTDADKDTLTYKWSYLEPGKSTWTEFSTLTAPQHLFTKKGVWSIRLEANDSFGGYGVQIKSLEVKNRPPVADFTHSPSTIYIDTNVTFTNQSSDVDGDVLTYQWAAKEPNSTIWTNFSTLKNPSRLLNKQGVWEVRLTVSDGVSTHSVTKSITVLNRLPVAGFNTDKNEYWIEDVMCINSTAYDPDRQSISVEYQIVLPSGKLISHTEPNFCWKVEEHGNVVINQTVTDEFGGKDSVQKVVPVRDLHIIGTVDHTQEWLVIHNDLGHPLHHFYSGEKKILNGKTSSAPVKYVKATLSTENVKGQNIEEVVPLNAATLELHSNEFFKEIYQNPETAMKNGPLMVTFEVEYSNGAIRSDVVWIEIVGSAFEGLQLHQSY